MEIKFEEGVDVEAVDYPVGEGCTGCVLFTDFSSEAGCTSLKCLPRERDDGRNVIFKLKVENDEF